MTPDPERIIRRCPHCRRIIELDDDGRFCGHTQAASDVVCVTSGAEPPQLARPCVRRRGVRLRCCDDCGADLSRLCPQPRCVHWKCSSCVAKNEADAKRHYRNSPRGKTLARARYLRRRAECTAQRRASYLRIHRPRQPYKQACENQPCPKVFIRNGAVVGWNRRFCDACLAAVWGPSVLRARRRGERMRVSRSQRMIA